MTINPYPGPMAPWPGLAPYGRRMNTAGGTALFLLEAGDRAAPPLVLIHGLGDEADTWRHVFGPLAETHHMIAVDLPGFGRSQPIASYRLPVVAHVLLSLLDSLGLPSATLVGSSMGAMLALLVALRAPERVAGLVLVDGTLSERLAAPFSWRALLMALPVTGSRLYTGLRRDARAAYETLRPFYHDLDGLSPADRRFLFQRVNERVWSDPQRRAYLGLYRDLAWAEPRRHPQRAVALAGLTVPTHLIWGEHDQIMPPAAAQAWLAGHPAARLTTIPGAGHLPHQEQPAAFVRAVRAALQMLAADQDGGTASVSAAATAPAGSDTQPALDRGDAV